MIERDIQFGDVVYLKSGGPALLVVDINEAGSHVTVAWLDESKRPIEHTFPSACLKMADRRWHQ